MNNSEIYPFSEPVSPYKEEQKLKSSMKKSKVASQASIRLYNNA